MYMLAVRLKSETYKFLIAQEPLLYLKPVQTGFPEDDDAALVVRLMLCGHVYAVGCIP